LPGFRQIIDQNGWGLAGEQGKNIMKMACYEKNRAPMPTWKGCGTKSAELLL